MNENPQKFNPLEGGIVDGNPLKSETNSNPNPEKFNPIPTEQELVDRGEIVLDPFEQAKKIKENEEKIADTREKLNKILSNPVVTEDGKFVPQEKTVENLEEINSPELPIPMPPEKKFNPLDGAMENGKSL